MFKKLRKYTFVGAVLSASMISSVALAVDGSVTFTSLVLPTCLVNLGTAGVMTASADAVSMDSANGTSGNAAIVATGAAFQVTTIAPADFTLKPPAYTSATTFTATNTGPGAGVSLPLGPTILTVDLKAEANSGTFVEGAYTAVVTVRCEPN